MFAILRTLALLIFGLSLQAAQNSQPIVYTTEICLKSAIADPQTVAVAKMNAGKMLREIGIAVSWHTDLGRCAGNPQNPFTIVLTRGTLDWKFPGALAYTKLREGHTEVFYDRVVRSVEPASTAKLLAHVFAHEICHLLQGVDHHSSEGLMKGHWEKRDILRLTSMPLKFNAEDVELIYRGIGRRESRVAFDKPPAQ